MLFGQATKKVSDKLTDETFYVLKSDMSTKHGEYNKFSNKNKLLVSGYYKLGVKDSIWQCYDKEGRITLTYDFTRNDLIFYEPSDHINDIQYRRINDNDTTLNRPPIFLGGEQLFLNEIAWNLRYPASARENSIMGNVYVTFIVNTNGKLINPAIKTPLGYGLDEEALRVIGLLPDNWLPGMFNGQAVDVEVSLPVSFRLK